MTKFKVGQIWVDRNGLEWVVDTVNDGGPRAYNKKYDLPAGKPSSQFGLNGQHETIYGYDLITLIKDVEDNVSNKFKVGARVKWTISAGEDEPEYKGTILDITEDINYPIKIKWDNGVVNTYSLEAQLLIITDDGITLEEAEAPVQKEVIEKLKKKFGGINKNLLPPEPIPGQYYRTRDGFKLLFIGKGKDYFYYESRPENGALCFVHPYQYHKNGSHDYDIVAPWTEPLPAMEIREWALVFREDISDGAVKRGKRYAFCDSLKDANSMRCASIYKDKLEIVELTGTLPAK
jgi:hypothetical protein